MDDQDLYWDRYAYRTLGESGMHAVKERFGYSLRSRVPHAMYAEIMLRLICHNVAQLILAVQEFNVDPRYWAQELIAKLPDLGTTMPPKTELERLGVPPNEIKADTHATKIAVLVRHGICFVLPRSRGRFDGRARRRSHG
ncbi:MAG TPA: hypothetical protein VMJ10_00305 [Kofleriaceae bacterium]|nr:hypothetical protein [Kofleriaceae bacterium]